MFKGIAILAFIAGAVLVNGWDKQKILVRFGINLLKFGSEYFKVIPLSITDAVAEGWEKYTPPTLPNGLESLVLYCPEDKDLTACAYYDDTGFIAGMQYSFDKECVKNPGFDMAVQGFSNWTVALSNGTEKEFWTSPQFYLDPEYLATESTTRIASRTSTSILQRDYIWVSGFNGELYRAPVNVTQLTSPEQGLTEQACIPLMGHHYHHNMSTTSECKSDKILPYFFVEYSKQFVAYGLMVYANNTCGSNWYENPSRSAIEFNLPKGPTCLFDMVDQYGILSIHTYVIDSPYFISCVFE